MKTTTIIHIEDLTEMQESLLQQLLQACETEYIEVYEDTTSILLVGELRIDAQRLQVWRSGNPVELTPMEFDILHLLARRPGQVFSARQIYESVMSASAEGSWTGISNMVYKLRRKLGPNIIETVRNIGYRFPTK